MKTPREIKPGERAYVLYLGVREYNGDLTEEVIFRNCWDNHEQAHAFLNGVRDMIKQAFIHAGLEAKVEEVLKLNEGSDAVEE